VYVLDSEKQQGKGYSKRKWTERSHVGLYLGPSPPHARSVHLVLNLETSFVSPQYHVSFDDHFETTRKGVEVLLPWLNWQECAHFTTAEKVPQLQPISPEVSGLRESDQQEKSSSNQKQSWKFFRRLRNL
jgi:hypothetical protein